MKARHLKVYGYIVPHLASLLIALIPAFYKPGFYLNIQLCLMGNMSFPITVLGVVVCLCAPYQYRIVVEDNADVLTFMGKRDVRQTFAAASYFQAAFLVFCLLCLYALGFLKTRNLIVGFFELLTLISMVVEALAMISNGSAYLRMREKIITDAGNNRTQP